MTKETNDVSAQCTLIKRHRPRKKMDIPEEYQPRCGSELGCGLATFQLSDKVTTRRSKFVSPFKASILYRQPPNVEKAMKLPNLILASLPRKELCR